MFFSLHGASPHWESAHRESNALLLVDAARKVLGERSTEFRSFSKDIMAEMEQSDDGRVVLRYLLAIVFLVPDKILTPFLHGSEDLLLMVQAATNAVKKRLDMASRALADFLNVSIFGTAGPGKKYAKILGATGDRAGFSLLEGLGGSNFKKAPFPTSDAHAAGSPLVKGDYNSKRELHFTIGLLRVFDAQVILVSTSRCSFLFDSELV